MLQIIAQLTDAIDQLELQVREKVKLHLLQVELESPEFKAAAFEDKIARFNYEFTSKHIAILHQYLDLLKEIATLNQTNGKLRKPAQKLAYFLIEEINRTVSDIQQTKWLAIGTSSDPDRQQQKYASLQNARHRQFHRLLKTYTRYLQPALPAEKRTIE